jgi:spore photoproduct lyase
MWNEIYVEKEILQHERVQSILQRFKKEPILLESYDEIWGRSKKPYLHKRDSLNLFLARKKGQLVKEAPPAYGKSGEPHYYFIHAYNCIYECQYCYLQGYFQTPDIVLFVNHEEIMEEMKNILDMHPGQNVWFHAGEFSDSLALSHLTGEGELYHQFCQENPKAQIELRTKAANVKALEGLKPLSNFIVSFSLSPESTSKAIDLKTPGASTRIKAMEILRERGIPIAAHFDPIIYQEGLRQAYKELLREMHERHLLSELRYLSLGVVRFTKDVHREVERNYPASLIHGTRFIKGFDQKLRYEKPLRNWILSTVKDEALKAGIMEDKIYLCMED